MMKKRILTLCLMIGLVSAITAQEMLVVTYYIRMKNDGDSLKGDCWGKRCQVIFDQVNFMSPAIFGTQ